MFVKIRGISVAGVLCDRRKGASVKSVPDWPPILPRLPAGAWKADGRAGFGNVDAFDFQDGFGKQPHLVVSNFWRENLREAAFQFVHAGNIGFAEVENFSVVAADDGRNFCFCPACDSPMRTMTSCRSNASDGGSVMSIFSPGVAVFIQASSAMTVIPQGKTIFP